MELKGKKALVTGGTSFIGSHLVERLIEEGCQVLVVDNSATSRSEILDDFLDHKQLTIISGDLREPGVVRNAVEGMDMVFHLAASHGGRGFIDDHQVATSTNLFLDGLVFWESHRANVEKVVFASSGCVYPTAMQADYDKEIYLKEDIITAPYDADNMYGWAKLMGELTLSAYSNETSMKTASCRFFNVYGPRCSESHAVMAMVGRAYVNQNPYEVWGDGRQVRNWTYVTDVVEGILKAAEKIDDGTPINIGASERVSVLQAVNTIKDNLGCTSELKFLLDKPTGPLNRSADNSLAKELLGWSPKVSFDEGIKKTIDWYVNSKNAAEVKEILKAKA